MPFPILGQRPNTPPVPPDPGTLGAIAWWRSDARVDVGGACDQLTDLTGNGRTLVASSAGQRPTIVPGYLDGHPGLAAASDKRMVCAAFNVSFVGDYPITWGFIFARNAPASQQHLFDSGAAGVQSDGPLARCGFGAAVEFGLFTAGTAQLTLSSGVLNDTDPHYMLATHDRAAAPAGDMFVDFAQTDTSGSSTVARTIDTCTLFARNDGAVPINGTFLEGFVFDYKLVGANLAALDGYVAARYPSL